MTEKKFEISSIIGDIDHDTICSRINLIISGLQSLSDKFRLYIDETKSDDELFLCANFRSWVICNLIIQSSLEDEKNESFNRMLYYLFEKHKHSYIDLITDYDIEINKTNDGNIDIKLLILNNEEIVK